MSEPLPRASDAKQQQALVCDVYLPTVRQCRRHVIIISACLRARYPQKGRAERPPGFSLEARILRGEREGGRENCRTRFVGGTIIFAVGLETPWTGQVSVVRFHGRRASSVRRAMMRKGESPGTTEGPPREGYRMEA